MTETNYAEFAGRITFNGEQAIEPKVSTEGLTEAELEQVHWAFDDFCKKLKSIDRSHRGNDTSGQSTKRLCYKDGKVFWK